MFLILFTWQQIVALTSVVLNCWTSGALVRPTETFSRTDFWAHVQPNSQALEPCSYILFKKNTEHIYFMHQWDFESRKTHKMSDLSVSHDVPPPPQGGDPIRMRGRGQSGQDCLTASLGCHGKYSQMMLDYVAKSASLSDSHPSRL